jgi:hypothetical protein
MRRFPLWMLMMAACGSKPAMPVATSGTSDVASAAPSASSVAPSAPASVPTEASSAVPPASTSAPVGPVPTGGSVMIGDIMGPPNFDPKPTLVALKPKLVDCFNQARAGNPSLHGKITMRILVNEAGTGMSAEADPGAPAYDPALVKCVDGVIKAGVKFPKPGGMATISAPFVFRP